MVYYSGHVRSRYHAHNTFFKIYKSILCIEKIYYIIPFCNILYNTLPVSYIKIVLFLSLSLSQKSRTHTVSVRVNSYITWYISVFFSFSCISPTLIKKITHTRSFIHPLMLTIYHLVLPFLLIFLINHQTIQHSFY